MGREFVPSICVVIGRTVSWNRSSTLCCWWHGRKPVKEIVKSAYEDFRSLRRNKLKATVNLKIAEFFCLASGFVKNAGL